MTMCDTTTKEAIPGAIRSLTCSCCGETTTGRQWWNQDTGYGICKKCIDKVRESAHYESHDGTPWTDKDAILEQLYGPRGTHFDIFTHSLCPTCGFNADPSGHGCNGWFGEDPRCGDCVAANKQPPAEKITCPRCGSDRVQLQMWVDANTKEVFDDTERYAWCNQCEDDGNDGEIGWNELWRDRESAADHADLVRHDALGLND